MALVMVPPGADGRLLAAGGTAGPRDASSGSRQRIGAHGRVWHDPGVTRLADAHVLVTGGSSGIGLETARQALARGARVSIVARDAERLDPRP